MAGTRAQDLSQGLQTLWFKLQQEERAAQDARLRYEAAERKRDRDEDADARDARLDALNAQEKAHRQAARDARVELERQSGDRAEWKIFLQEVKKNQDKVDAWLPYRNALRRDDYRSQLATAVFEARYKGPIAPKVQTFTSQIGNARAAIDMARGANPSLDYKVALRKVQADSGGAQGLSDRFNGPMVHAFVREYAANPTDAVAQSYVQAYQTAQEAATNTPAGRAVAPGAPASDTSKPGGTVDAEKWLQDKVGNYRREREEFGAGRQGTSPGASGTPGAPGTPAPKIPESPIVEQILKKAMQEGTMPPQPPGATYDYKTTYGGTAAKPEGAPALNYIDDNSLRTYTNVPWEVTGEMKPRYMEALKKAHPEWAEKPPPGGGAKTPAGGGAKTPAGGGAKTPAGGDAKTPAAPPARPVSAEPNPLASTVARALNLPLNALGIPPPAVDAAVRWGPSIFSGASQFLSGDPGSAPVAPVSAPSVSSAPSTDMDTHAAQVVQDARAQYGVQFDALPDASVDLLAQRNQPTGADPDVWRVTVRRAAGRSAPSARVPMSTGRRVQ